MMKLTVGRGNKAVTVVSEFEMAIATGYRFCLDNSVGYTEGNSSYWTSGVKEDYFWEVEVPRLVQTYSTETCIENGWLKYNDKGELVINKPPKKR
jgi:hypothetical protein